MGTIRQTYSLAANVERISRSAKLGLALLLALGLVSLYPSPVLAAIAQPTDLEIQAIEAYQSVKVTGDQLYIIEYFIDFTTLPDESAEDLFIFRLLDESDNEIASTSPYAFHDNGYGLGVVAFYLTPEDAPTWESTVSIELAGNPLADWTGDPPITITNAVDWSTGTTDEIQELTSSTIIYLATDLEQSWVVEMITASQGITVLSDTGAAYFLRVIPYLKDVAPYAIGSYVFDPDYPADKPASTDYQDELYSGVDDTIFDISHIAYVLKISRGSLSAIIYYGLVLFFFVFLIAKKKLKRGMALLLWPVMIGGAVIGVPLWITVLAGFIAFMSTVWVVYKGA